MKDPLAIVADSLLPSADAATLQHPSEIASDQDILERFVAALHRCGVVGEDRNAKLIYLALTSRLLDEPVSLALKGVSSSGKSKTVESSLRFFPDAAYIALTAMSERALVYMKEDFAHRTLVLFEAVALREQREKTESNLTAYFVRSLLSEGRINYPVTQRDKDGNFVTRSITKKGPTNLILTTTATSLHGENETRMISLPTNDTPGQTRAILRQLATGSPRIVDLEPWRAFQSWLEGAEHRVEVPFARFLADSIPESGLAVRLRRDFRSILRLIETHAIVHQRSRERDDEGRILATDEDYVAVRDLVADLVSEGIGATVSDSIRETVQCVRELSASGGVAVRPVAERLGLDKSAAARRLQSARERGFIVNEEDRRGRPARYVINEPMPDELELLPQHCTTPSDVSAGQGDRRSVAVSAGREGEGYEHA